MVDADDEESVYDSLATADSFFRFGDSLEFISLLYFFVVGNITKLLSPLFFCNIFIGAKNDDRVINPQNMLTLNAARSVKFLFCSFIKIMFSCAHNLLCVLLMYGCKMPE